MGNEATNVRTKEPRSSLFEEHRRRQRKERGRGEGAGWTNRKKVRGKEVSLEARLVTTG